MEVSATLKPLADTFNGWTLLPSDGSSAAAHLDEPLEQADGDATHARSAVDGATMRLQMELTPANLDHSTRIRVRASVEAEAPVETEARVNVTLYVRGIAKSKVVLPEPLLSSPYTVVEWTAPDWQAVAGEPIEVEFESTFIQSDPPAFTLRVRISAADVVVDYVPLPRFFFTVAGVAGSAYTEIGANNPVYTPLSEPTTIYTPVVVS